MVNGVFSTMGTFWESAYFKAAIMLRGLVCSPPRQANGVNILKIISESHWVKNQRLGSAPSGRLKEVRLATTTSTMANRMTSTNIYQ